MSSDDKKITSVIEKVLKLLNKEKLSVPELIVLYGNLGIHIGCGVAGITTIPNLEEAKREYYSNPTIDMGLILQGYLITSWEEDYIKNPQLSRLAKPKVEKKE